MTQDLKAYVESLSIQLYRLSDGSLLLSEESHRDNVDDYVVLRRPLHMTSVLVDGALKTAFIPWMPGADDHVRVRLQDIIAEMDASFDQKFAYSRYYLIEHLQKHLSTEQFTEIMQNQKDTVKPLPQEKVQKFKSELAKNKRFNLN